jgi:energy-coupling factor transport system ATP-binding protein
MNDIARLADKVLVMDGGKLAIQGTPEEVFAQHEKLTEIGLALPHSAELMKKAAEKGLNFEGNFLTLDDVEEEIYNYLKKD